MKNQLLLILICLCLFNINLVTAQSTDFDTTYQQRLYHLGKVWGYVKYFHPKVAKCDLDWDQTLVDAIPSIKEAPSNESFNDLLIDLMDIAGPIQEATIPAEEIAQDLRYNLNLDWFEESILSQAVKERLIELRDNFRPRKHCKLGEAFQGGNPTFDNDGWLFETNQLYPTEAQRALAIYRYWNAINYFFPYKNLMDQDWDKTLLQFIPAIVGATNELAYHLAFKEMTTYINDSHAFFSSQPYWNWAGLYLAPFRLKYVENQTVITAVHNLANDKIQVGDVITAIDGESISAIRNRVRKYIGASNPPTIERNINSRLTQGQQGGFELRIKNDTGEKTVQLNRTTFESIQSLYNVEGKISYEQLVATGGCRVGYIDMAVLQTEEVPRMFQAFNDLPAIIVDIRNYPNGTLWSMVDFLYPNPINFASFTQPNIRYPGTLNFYQHSIGQGGLPYRGRLILLFDEDTQSQAEFTVMGLEFHPNSIKIGNQTAGADGNVSTLFLPGGIRTLFTGLGVFYPDGTETQRIGMVPDIKFHPTIKGIREGKDEMLEFALDCELLGAEIPEVVSENGVDVFPNPVQNNLFINSIHDGEYTVRVSDIAGRFIEGFNISNSLFSYSMDMSKYHSGTYILTFQNQDGVFATKKLVRL